MKYLRTINKFLFLLTFSVLVNFYGVSSQVVGDYGSIVTGNWGPGIWGIYNGATWPATAGSPSQLNNVFIRSGTTVTVTTSPMPCGNLTVEAGAILLAGAGGNLYISVYGSSLICNGQIGNGAIFDQISFNIEGANVTISGTGAFDASRMRKSFAFNSTTNLTIMRNINLRWNSGTASAQLYNNASLTLFNVTINAGSTVNLIQSGPSTGNVCIDGNNGADPIEGGGTFTINGTLIISGIFYSTTNNTNLTYPSKWIINGLVRAYEVIAAASGVATNSLTINIGGKLDITGPPAFSSLSTTNNSYIFMPGSTVEYSALGNQNVRVRSEFAVVPVANNGYYNLILSGSGNKSTTLTNLWVRNDLTITGSAILDPNPAINNILIGGNWLNYNSIGFSEKTSTVFINGAGLQTITCPGGEVFNILRYQKTVASHLQFNDSVDVITQLLFTSPAGYVDLNSNPLTIRNSATTGISGYSAVNYIVSEKTDNSSKIIWRINSASGVYTFPFGVIPGGAANYIPVILNKTNASSIGDVTFSTYGTPPNNLTWPITPIPVTNLQAYITLHNVPDNRHWTVDRFWEVGATTPVMVDSVIFSYRAIELPDSDTVATNLGAQFWNTSYWYNQQYGTGIAYNVGVPSFTIYNTSWTLTSLTSPLPIKLLFFDALQEENKDKLSWSTASEINNDYFTVEKSIDGDNFFPIGNVSGSGNSTTTHQYYLDDNKPFFGISYYRLKQTDFDGAFSFSDVIPVNYKKAIANFSIFPNPTNDNTFLISESGIKSEIFIRNMEGKAILYYLVDKSKPILSLQTTDLKQGLYIVEVKSEFDTQYLKLIKN